MHGRCECAGEEPGLVVMDATLGGRSSSISFWAIGATCQRFPMSCGTGLQMLVNLGSYLPTFVVNYSILKSLVGHLATNARQKIFGASCPPSPHFSASDAMWDRIVVFLAFLAHHIDAARLTPRANTIDPRNTRYERTTPTDGRGCVDSP